MALFIYLLLGIVILAYEFMRKKYFKIDLISFFNFFFFLVYAFTPAALILEGNQLISDDMIYGSDYFGHNIFTPYIVFASYLFFLAGLHTLSWDKNRYNYELKLGLSEDGIFKILPFAYVMLFIFIAIYVNEVGGLSKAIELAEAYRSGALPYPKFGFVMRFFPLNTILLYYVYYKYFLEKRQNSWLLLYFIFSLVIVGLITVLENSRGYLIFQLAGLYVITANYHKNYFLKYLIPTLLTVFIIIKYGKPLFNSIQYLFADGYDAFVASVAQRVELKEQEASLISNFTHPIVSLEASLARSGYDISLRYFCDFIDAFLMLLPNELLGIKEPEMTIMKQNTQLLGGIPVDMILPGILGFFSYAGQVVGVFLGSYLYGFTGVLLMKFFNHLYKNTKASIVYIYIFSLTYGHFVFRGVPAHVLEESFMYFVVIAFLLFNSKLKISKNSEGRY